jgi:putative redox protein
MEVSIRYLNNVRFEAATRGHSVISDQPASNGGEDGGMTPPELLLSALGACAGYYAVEYLKARALSGEGLEILVTADKALQPARLDRFRIEIALPGLDAAHETGILRAVKACLIHHTLLHQPVIETVFKAVATVG